jgi:hypothetical protein
MTEPVVADGPLLTQLAQLGAAAATKMEVSMLVTESEPAPLQVRSPAELGEAAKLLCGASG